MNPYIGHPSQIFGVEDVRLIGGKGDGMRLLNVRNAGGLCFTVSADRCADLSRVSFGGVNYGFFAPCGYVSPAYYDGNGTGFLKSFTAGFLTTCGLRSVGSPCMDGGEVLPLHGTISNTPCESISYQTTEDAVEITATVRDASLFSHQLVMERRLYCPIDRNVITLTDTVRNIGSSPTPFQMLYHCNLGYPLLSETAELSVPSEAVRARNAHAQSGIGDWSVIEKPQRGYEEMCFYHTMHGPVTVSLYNPRVNRGLDIRYDAAELPCFTEWKMMGEHEYVLGLEPGNCLPDGRDQMRAQGMLAFLAPDESKTHHLEFRFWEK